MHRLPNGILGDPGIIFVPEVDGFAQPVQRLGGIPLDRAVRCQAEGHFTVG